MKKYETRIHGDAPVLTHFYASWSPSGHLLMPVVAELKKMLGQRIIIQNADIEKEKDLAALHHIQTVPTVIIFDNGCEVWRKTGIVSAHEILEHLQMMID